MIDSLIRILDAIKTEKLTLFSRDFAAISRFLA